MTATVWCCWVKRIWEGYLDGQVVLLMAVVVAFFFHVTGCSGSHVSCGSCVKQCCHSRLDSYHCLAAGQAASMVWLGLAWRGVAAGHRCFLCKWIFIINDKCVKTTNESQEITQFVFIMSTTSNNNNTNNFSNKNNNKECSLTLVKCSTYIYK